MNIAVIGAGNIGATLTRYLTAAGHHVTVANRRGPQSLADLAAGTGAHPAALADVTQNVQVVIVSVPLFAVPGLCRDGLILPDDAVVIDTGNYVPHLRDGQISELDDGEIESRWTERHLGHPVVKAFNTITAASLRDRPTSAGTPTRVALPIAGDDARAKAVAIGLANQIGFDALDAGGLDDSWRQQPGTPVYTTDLTINGIDKALADADPAQTNAWRARLATTTR